MFLDKTDLHDYYGVEYEDYYEWCIEKHVKGRGRDRLEGMFVEFA